MKRFYFRFRILLLTLALGLSSVNFVNWLNDYWSEVSVDLPKVESKSPIIVLPREKAEMPYGGEGCGNGIKKGVFVKYSVKYSKETKIQTNHKNKNAIIK